MTKTDTITGSGDTPSIAPQTHKDWMLLLWTLRIAAHIPEILDRDESRSAAATTLSIIAPWVDWPESLLQSFETHLRNEDDLDLRGMGSESSDTETMPLEIREQLKRIDCSILAKPFQEYYKHRKHKVGKLISRAEENVKAMPSYDEMELARNTAWLSELVGLNDAESAFLLLSLYVRESAEMKAIFNAIPFKGIRKAASQFGWILGQESSEMQRALSPGSKLHGLGLFRGQYHVSDLDDLIPNDPKVHNVLSMNHADAESLVSLFLEKSKGTELTADDFSHLKDALEDLSTIVQSALAKHEKGVNILFYGPPGTGKTQLSRLIAQTIGCSLYEVRWHDEQHEPATATERLMGLELGQNFLKNQANAFLLFDEVEAVFEGENDGMGSLSRLLGAKGHARNENKAWINQTLDNNSAVPTIWIANEIDRFDPAFLRRFIYCLEFKIPPRRVRRRAIDRYLGESHLSDDFKDRLSTQWISAAQIEMALRSTRLLNLTNQKETETAVLRSIKASMAVMGQEFIDEARTASSYRLDYLNVESPIPIERWADMARNGHSLSICLAGPPGAGKSQLARFLADQLDKPLLAKRGSDLLSKWVGGTEAHLAAMFREAKEEQAILLLDEADSMLRNREQATQGWQVSQVNELLQQMEGFNGIFICTTNRFEDLDPAALRRFSLKVRFHAMTADQRWKFLLEMTGHSNQEFPGASKVRMKLDRLEGVTPGDFAVAARQFQMLNQTPDPFGLLTTLEQEIRTKNWNSQQKAIGFLH